MSLFKSLDNLSFKAANRHVSLGKGDTWLHTTENFSTRFIEPRVSSTQGWLWQFMNCCKGKRYRDVLPSIFRSVPYVYGNIWRHATLSERNPAPPGIYESLYEVGLTTYELVPNFLPSTVWCVWMCLIPSSQVVTVTSLQSVGRLRRFSKGLIYLIYLGILNASLRTTWKCNATHKGYPQTMRNCTQLGFFTQRSWGPALFWIFPTCTGNAISQCASTTLVTVCLTGVSPEPVWNDILKTKPRNGWWP